MQILEPVWKPNGHGIDHHKEYDAFVMDAFTTKIVENGEKVVAVENLPDDSADREIVH